MTMETCMVTVDDVKCNAEAPYSYRCVIEFEDKPEEIHTIHVCNHHNRYYQDMQQGIDI
jgi:hypothetical protein